MGGHRRTHSPASPCPPSPEGCLQRSLTSPAQRNGTTTKSPVWAGLGDEFVAEVDAVIKSLADNPYLHAVRFADVRCARLKRFKRYGVYYFIWHDEVIVFSVFHGSQHPRRLRQRLRDVT